MDEFTEKKEQAFLDGCGAIGVMPNAMVNTRKERYLVSEFLKNPVSWLETESLYHSLHKAGRGPGGRASWPEQVVSSTKAFKRAVGYSVRVLTQEYTEHMAINVKPLGDRVGEPDKD